MPKTPPKKRTAQIVPKKSTKKHAAIVKKVPPSTLITGGTGFLGAHLAIRRGSPFIRTVFLIVVATLISATFFSP